jgi:hypothetical protein
MIGDVIDFGQEEEGMLVQQGVCQDLDELKATYQAMPDYLTQAGAGAKPARIGSSRVISCWQFWYSVVH